MLTADHGAVTLKGKTKLVRVYSLMGLRLAETLPEAQAGEAVRGAPVRAAPPTAHAGARMSLADEGGVGNMLPGRESQAGVQ